MRLLALAILCTASACADNSGLLVLIDAEGLSRVRGTELTMVVRDSEGDERLNESTAPDALPYRLYLRSPSAGRHFSVEVDLADRDGEVFSRVNLAGTVPTGELLYAGACLRDECMGTVCGGGQTCEADACVDVDTTFYATEDEVPPCWTHPCAEAETVCDGIDDDCNGAIDEGLRNACGACGPVGEDVCDDEDNDCDGTVDEGVRNACNECGPVPEETCNAVDDDCNGACDDIFLCRTAIYHGYHSGEDHHLYCTTEAECTSNGLELSGTNPAFHIYATTGPELLPLWRCNQVMTGAHRYRIFGTCARSEGSGIQGYAADEPVCNAVRLYELTHLNRDGEPDFLYTTDEIERALIVDGTDWTVTGRIIYAWPP